MRGVVVLNFEKKRKLNLNEVKNRNQVSIYLLSFE
jgi:hypothetical protein